jgi:hypothetical protein
MMCHKIGLPPISTIGLGRISVSSANLVPRPPARMATIMAQLLFVDAIDLVMIVFLQGMS